MAEVVVNRHLLKQVASDLTMLHAQRLIDGAGCCAEGPCPVQQRVTRLNGLLSRSPQPASQP